MFRNRGGFARVSTANLDAGTKDLEQLLVCEEELIEYDPEPLKEDLYGVGITSLIRDVRKVALGEGRCCLRFTRATVTVMVLWLTIAMQVFLMVEFKKLITSSAVTSIRKNYSMYEKWMYEGHTEKTANGFHRGIPGHFNKARFHDLPEEIDKDFICSCPLAQQYFFVCILMIWSFTVIIDLREILFYMDLLLIRTDTIPSAKDMLEEQADHSMLLKGLTRCFKALLCVFIFLPRMLIDVVLLWLGCRWLTATASFGEVLLNAIALEFVLLLKDLIYFAAVPKRNQWETTKMLVPHKRQMKAGWASYLGAFLWILVVIIWVYLYIHYIQQVLPDYRWDIQEVCEGYIRYMTGATATAEEDADGSAMPPISGHGHRYGHHHEKKHHR